MGILFASLETILEALAIELQLPGLCRFSNSPANATVASFIDTTVPIFLFS